MEYSDRLYGVTMQESGVSKLVSVNLNTIDEGYEGGTSMSFFKRLKDKFSTKSTEDIEQELSEEEGNQSSTIHDDNDEAQIEPKKNRVN